jgi:hypothetical protein
MRVCCTVSNDQKLRNVVQIPQSGEQKSSEAGTSSKLSILQMFQMASPDFGRQDNCDKGERIRIDMLIAKLIPGCNFE